MTNPEELKYTEDHEWIQIQENIATIGVSQYAVDELGEVVFVELPTEKDNINQKDEFGTIESVKTVSSLYTPISGTIHSVNQELENNPNLVSTQPFSEGWIIKVEISDPTELDDLMTHTEYQSYLETLA